jgi:tetratricopeptide (TPR) repeat protein
MTTGDGAMSLDAAIQRTAEEIAAALPGKRLAIDRFEAETPELSRYITDELTGALVRTGTIPTVERRNLEYIKKELNLQESGVTSGETSLSIGKMLGAQSLATGSLVKVGGEYRWRVRVTGVETAAHEADMPLRVKAGKNFTALLAALTGGSKTADTSYRDLEQVIIPQTAADYLNRGLIFAMRGDFELSLEDFNEAVQIDPNFALAWLQRGKVLLARQSKVTKINEGFELIWTVGSRGRTADDDKAFADFTQAIKLSPNLAAAYVYRGALYTEITEYDKAITDLNQAIRINPNSAVAYRRRGIVYNAKGDYDRAIADYTQAVKLDPNDAYAYSNRGNTYKNKGDYDKAIADYTQAINLDPDYVNAYNNRGDAYYFKHDYDKAIADYSQAVRIAPNDATGYYNRGEAYRMKGQYDAAVKDLTEAIRLSPTYAFAYASRGLTYNRLGQKTQAIQDLEKAVSLDPNYTWAKDRLKEVRGW